MGMLKHHQKVLDTPLWFNDHLPELSTVPDPQLWAAYGIIYLSHVLTGTGPISFQSLKERFSLPNQLLFRYLQLRHAHRAQMASTTIGLETPPVLDILLRVDPTKLISNLYYVLRLHRSHKVSQLAKEKWEQDKGPIENPDWVEILEGIKTASPKLSDRLTQLNIILSEKSKLLRSGCRQCPQHYKIGKKK